MNSVCPRARFFNPNSIVRYGWPIVPGEASLPVVDTNKPRDVSAHAALGNAVGPSTRNEPGCTVFVDSGIGGGGRRRYKTTAPTPATIAKATPTARSRRTIGRRINVVLIASFEQTSNPSPRHYSSPINERGHRVLAIGGHHGR